VILWELLTFYICHVSLAGFVSLDIFSRYSIRVLQTMIYFSFLIFAIEGRQQKTIFFLIFVYLCSNEYLLSAGKNDF